MKNLKQGLTATILFVLLCGAVFPLALTGVSQLLFAYQANGSLVQVDDQLVGSKLIGQDFTDSQYFTSRPSAITYNMTGENTPSGSNNYSVSDPKLMERIEASITQLIADNPGLTRETIPLDLVTESASGLDPHISYEGAMIQVKRVAAMNNLSDNEVINVINEQVDHEGNINVLLLNIAIDALQ